VSRGYLIHRFDVHSVVAVLGSEEREVGVDEVLLFGLLLLASPVGLGVGGSERLAGRVGAEHGAETIPDGLEVALHGALEVDDVDAVEEDVVGVGGDEVEGRVDGGGVPRDVQTVAVVGVLVVFLQRLLSGGYHDDVVGVVLGVLEERGLVDEVLHDRFFDLREVFLERVVEDHRRVDELVVRQADLLVQVRQPQVHLRVTQLHLSPQRVQVPS
jgi:hypothetical protein